MQGKTRDMTEGSPLRHIIIFMIPMMIGGFFQQFYNVADTLVVGNMVGSDALAAIGATGSSTFFMLSLTMGLTNAFSIVISQSFGAKNEDLVRRNLVNSIYIMGAAAVILTLIGLFGSRPLMRLMRTPADIIDQSVIYLQICIGGCVAQLAYNMASSALRAVGNSRTPLYFLIFTSILNVALDLLFVLAFHMGVAGVAIATVISQAISAALSIRYIVKYFPIFHLRREDMHPDKEIILRLLRMGLPMSFQMSLLSIGDMVITGIVNGFGTNVVASFSVGGRVQQFASLAFSNATHSFSTYAGQNLGANKPDRVRYGFNRVMGITIVMSALSAVLVFFFGDYIVRFFLSGSDPQLEAIVEISRQLLRITACFYPFLGIIWLYTSTLRGVGEIRIPFLSCMVELVAKISLSIGLSVAFGYVGIWYAGPIGWVLGIIPPMICYHRGKWEKNAERLQTRTKAAEA